MSAQLATRAGPVACDGCGQGVLRIFTTEQRSVVLDATPQLGGLYAIDSKGRAARHRLTTMLRASTAGCPLMGYDVHDCTPVAWWDR